MVQPLQHLQIFLLVTQINYMKYDSKLTSFCGKLWYWLLISGVFWSGEVTDDECFSKILSNDVNLNTICLYNKNFVV
jgi:hypothetical protein